MKRKVKQNAAINNNKTPKESLPDAEFALEYEGENSAKYANRNSKVKKMRRFYKRLIFCGIIKVFKLFVNLVFNISRKMRKT